MTTTHRAWIGMGSNQGDRREILQAALDSMASKGISLLRISHTYETEPVGFTSDDRFLNAAVEIEWFGSPAELLHLLMETEKELGRIRTGLQRYESRSIDLDILLFEQKVINSPELTIPHPRMAERRFALEPLNDLIPSYIHPVLGVTIGQLLESCDTHNEAFIRCIPLSIPH